MKSKKLANSAHSRPIRPLASKGAKNCWWTARHFRNFVPCSCLDPTTAISRFRCFDTCRICGAFCGLPFVSSSAMAVAAPAADWFPTDVTKSRRRDSQEQHRIHPYRVAGSPCNYCPLGAARSSSCSTGHSLLQLFQGNGKHARFGGGGADLYYRQSRDVPAYAGTRGRLELGELVAYNDRALHNRKN